MYLIYVLGILFSNCNFFKVGCFNVCQINEICCLILTQVQSGVGMSFILTQVQSGVGM